MRQGYLLQGFPSHEQSNKTWNSWSHNERMLDRGCDFILPMTKYNCDCITMYHRLYGGFLKWWLSPTTMSFPTRNDQPLGCVFWGNTPFKETPIWHTYNEVFVCKCSDIPVSFCLATRPFGCYKSQVLSPQVMDVILWLFLLPPNSHRIHGTGIFTYIYHKSKPNVGKYTIHGSYGIWNICTNQSGI